MSSRIEAATRAYPYHHEDKIPPELMDMMRHSLRAADEVMFSEESVKKAIGEAKYAMRDRRGYITLTADDYENIIQAVIYSLKQA